MTEADKIRKQLIADTILRCASGERREDALERLTWVREFIDTYDRIDSDQALSESENSERAEDLRPLIVEATSELRGHGGVRACVTSGRLATVFVFVLPSIDDWAAYRDGPLTDFCDRVYDLCGHCPEVLMVSGGLVLGVSHSPHPSSVIVVDPAPGPAAETGKQAESDAR